MSDDAKRWAWAEMRRQGLSVADLARKARVSRPMLAMLLKIDRVPPINSSRIWPEVVEALGGAVPELPNPEQKIDEDQRVLLEKFSQLSEQSRKAVIALVLSLTSDKT